MVLSGVHMTNGARVGAQRMSLPVIGVNKYRLREHLAANPGIARQEGGKGRRVRISTPLGELALRLTASFSTSVGDGTDLPSSGQGASFDHKVRVDMTDVTSKKKP